MGAQCLQNSGVWHSQWAVTVCLWAALHGSAWGAGGRVPLAGGLHHGDHESVGV